MNQYLIAKRIEELISSNTIEDFKGEDFNLLEKPINYFSHDYTDTSNIKIPEEEMKLSTFLILIISSSEPIWINHQEEIYSKIKKINDNVNIISYRNKDISIKNNKIEIFYN